MSEAQWYVAHTYSGYENKVKVDIEKTIENRGLQDQILEVSVPVQEVVEIRNGQKKLVQKKLLPGYVLVHMIMNDDTWYVVRNTRGVTGFVGPGSKPVPLTEDEKRNMGLLTSTTGEAEAKYHVGDSITVVKGPWEGTVGLVQDVNATRQTVSINVDMFGRETPVELSFTEVKISQ